MKKLKAYKFALTPTPSQVQKMKGFAGSYRFVYNKALALQKECHEKGEKKLSYTDMCKLLAQWRHDPEILWLADSPVPPLQQALKNLDRAYPNFFAKRAAFPRFKKKGLSENVHYPDSKQFIANARLDYLHKASLMISQSHAVVCIEDLQVDHMSKSAKGKGVAAKSGLNKAILGQGWGEFRRQLDYKLAWEGGHLIAVPPKNTSRTCPKCGHVSGENRKTQVCFVFTECGFKENDDLVGALNVLRAGHAQLAYEVSGALMPPVAGTLRTILAKSERTA